MRVLVACEFSGVVRDAFRDEGHDAMSCDLLPTERPGPHYEGDVRDVLADDWDLMVAHPPCTYLALSGMRWYSPDWNPPDKLAARIAKRDEALDFIRTLLAAPIPHIALEQPMSLASSMVRPHDQAIQPWMFGHGEVKTTWLWLKNLPRLHPTHPVEGRIERVHLMSPGPDRWRERSRTLPGVAAAMADQWGRADAVQLELGA